MKENPHPPLISSKEEFQLNRIVIYIYHDHHHETINPTTSIHVLPIRPSPSVCCASNVFILITVRGTRRHTIASQQVGGSASDDERRRRNEIGRCGPGSHRCGRRERFPRTGILCSTHTHFPFRRESTTYSPLLLKNREWLCCLTSRVRERTEWLVDAPGSRIYIYILHHINSAHTFCTRACCCGVPLRSQNPRGLYMFCRHARTKVVQASPAICIPVYSGITERAFS